MSDEVDVDYVAPDGQTWVCAACGKNGRDRMGIGDSSCFLNAVLCYVDRADGVWRAAKGAE